MKNQTAPKILIVDDDPAFCEAKSKRLQMEGFTVQTTTDPKEALVKISAGHFDLVLTDLKMKEISGIELTKKTKEISPDTEIIVITGFADIETAVEAIKAGAYDYLAKSSSNQEILLKISHALERRMNLCEITKLRETLKEKYSFRDIIGKTEKIQEVYNLIRTVSDTDVPVLIRGETGTGKELVARAVHFTSRRKDKPFIVLNCAAISPSLIESELFGHEKGAFTGAVSEKPGKLEIADGGTVFLDEIGDMSVELQAKLLRVLQDNKFERVGGTRLLSTDARIISATNRNLEELIKEGKFREDLFYRINVVNINLPPLRERIEDIVLLIDHFLHKFNREFNKRIEGFSKKAVDLLFSYNWPGNIRELENLIRKLTLITNNKNISFEETKKNLRDFSYLKTAKGSNFKNLRWKEMMENTEKTYFESLLKQFGGRLTPVYKKAGIHRRTLYKKMKIYNLKKEDFIP